MDRYNLEDFVAPQQLTNEVSPLKDWRLKYQAGTLRKNDFMDFFQKESRKYFNFKYELEKDATKPSRTMRLPPFPDFKKIISEKYSLKCLFKETEAKEGIIDILLEFILGDNPTGVLGKLELEGNTAAVCGKVFKNGEPTYSCRECGMDPTCVLCVNCFKNSQHRYHKYKMSTSGGGGCCDCGDEEAWKKHHYCETHLRSKENPPDSTIITDAIKERCEIAFIAILMFCVNFLEMESNASLKCLDGDEEEDGVGNFCTVLYNDESHTFDQVIQTLMKIVKCRHKDAVEIVASIDREGRAVVKCDTFSECCQLKEGIEKQSVTSNSVIGGTRTNHSLRLSVLHVRAVANQQFALQLLSWFQDFLTHHCIFRKIFARLILDKNAPYSISHILEYDVKLWKTARTAWHRLLISAMLMEYDNKMALAQEFARHYATVVQDFIRDDHEHSFSIVSLSVQLFTVPSIAHYLIANEGIFYKLVHTFYHESIEKFIENGTLRFTKNMSLGFFKRSAYILYDLRYILSFKPDAWTDELRDGFHEGCKTLLRLLNVMQGMEAITRQTGQHMDYEPEWESAFNLHIKLANTISLMLEWCASDEVVLTKLYQMVMNHLLRNNFILNEIKTEEVTVAGHIANCFVYDVATQPVSIHLPLSRLYAGVYLHLGKYGLSYDNVSKAIIKRTPEQIMEPILCTQTLIAQVHSNMWRRNGYSLLHQMYFYRNVRCRAEMLDRDIVGMQIGAALIESNQYLIRIMHKFNLVKWFAPEYLDSITPSPIEDEFVRQISMVDEFLELLIVIISERYVPGISDVTEEDRIKKEIIQLLCIKPYSHSELSRAMPDSNNDTVLEDVIESIAVFKKPQKTELKGVYELKDDVYNDYNMYFYHYTKEEKSKSEETQRMRRKNKGELVCCPPPLLSKLTPGFCAVANLLQCDVMMYIISTVLDRVLNVKVCTYFENHLQKVLYLIGTGLQEEQTGFYPFLTFYANSQNHNILAKLEELSRSPKVEAHRDLVIWTIKKFKEFQNNETAKSADTEMQTDDIETPSAAGAGDECKVGDEAVTAAEQEKREKEERSRLAAERRAKIMAQMQKAQNSFMQSNAELFASTNSTTGATGATGATRATAMEWQTEPMEEIEEEGAAAYKTVACLGVDRRLQTPEEQRFKCILCFEECSLSKDGPTLVYSAFIQKSMVLPTSKEYGSSIYTSSCGHVMHVTCWQEYYNNEESKERRLASRSRQPFPQSQCTDFQCPYCRCLSNAVIPLTTHLSKFSPPTVIHAGEELFPHGIWIEKIKSFGESLTKLQDAELWFYEMPTMITMFDDSKLLDDFEKFAQAIPKFDPPQNWEHFAQHYMRSARQYAPSSVEVNDMDGILWMWHSCMYTVQSVEMYLRAIEKPFKNGLSIRQESCLSGLIRATCVYASNLSQPEVKNLVLPVADFIATVFNNKSISVLEWNIFSMMTYALCIVPNMLYAVTLSKTVVSSGSMMDFYTMQLFFMANIVKAIVLFDKAGYDESMELDEEQIDDEIKYISEEMRERICSFYRRFNLPARRRTREMLSKRSKPTENLSEESSTEQQNPIECNSQCIAAIFKHVKAEMYEYLRCCCLLFHFITDVEYPDEFAQIENYTFENMCAYLGLKTNLTYYFDYFYEVLETFASHPDIVSYNFDTNKKENGENIVVRPCTLKIPSLVQLPDDYSDLINSVSDFSCPNNEREEMKTPTMCLKCSLIVCGQSYCCQPELDMRAVGACTYHAHFCGADIGIFLRIRDCQVVYLSRVKGCFIQPPYLDEYGETDQGLRRGNPLRLCPTRYKKIHLAWLGHGLYDEIARLNDNTSIAVTQWHHM